MPAVFPPRNYKGDVLMDGGTVWNTNLISAVQKCLEVVDSKAKIVIDIAICSHAELAPMEKAGNTIDNFFRYRDIKKQFKVLDDILEFKKSEPEVTFRYFFVPSKELLESPIDMLFFDTEHVLPMIETGKSDAVTVLAMGEGKSFERFISWKSSQDL